MSCDYTNYRGLSKVTATDSDATPIPHYTNILYVGLTTYYFTVLQWSPKQRFSSVNFHSSHIESDWGFLHCYRVGCLQQCFQLINATTSQIWHVSSQQPLIYEQESYPLLTQLLALCSLFTASSWFAYRTAYSSCFPSVWQRNDLNVLLWIPSEKLQSYKGRSVYRNQALLSSSLYLSSCLRRYCQAFQQVPFSQSCKFLLVVWSTSLLFSQCTFNFACFRYILYPDDLYDSGEHTK